MLKISQKTKPNSAAIIIPMNVKLPQLYDGRLSLISNMSGYPSAVHVIGRLQRQIDLSSYDAMLRSIKKLRDLTKITADVIDSMEGVKVDKFQLNRVEIIAYVQNVTANINSFKPDVDDIDLIAHLITSYEANTGAWVLQGAMKDRDMHLEFKKIYSSVLTDNAGSDLPVYAPHEDDITTLGTLPQFASKVKKDKGNQSDDTVGMNDSLRSASTLYRLAAARITDHVYQLMMDRDVWYSFVSPRAKAEIASNLERSKSLKVFSLYLQSLLSYNQFFMLETFMKGYELVQSWITHFPPLEASTTHKLDSVVRPHDLLNARQDVNSLFSSFGENVDQTLAKQLVIFPEELVSSFGISKAIRRINDTVVKFAVNSDFKDAGDLDDKRYLPLLAGVAADNFNISHDLATVILTGKIVSGEIDKALADLVPALVRGSSKATIETLKGLGLSSKLPFQLPHALQWHVTKGVVKGLENGKLSLDSASPSFSWAYHEHIRKNFKFKMATDDQIALAYPHFVDRQVVDRDKASSYRELFGYQWRSLVPDTWQTGHTIYTESMLKSDPSVVRQLIESISGKNFEIAVREIGVDHLAKVWATYLSSFALLYVDGATIGRHTKGQGDKEQQVILVEGHGKPYGASYSALENKQRPITSPEDYIRVAEGIYIRILDRIPVVTDDLIIDPHFFLEHPSMYFASNSETIEVKQWVIDESLLHLCLIPVHQSAFVPKVMFTNKYAYITSELMMNMDIYFKPAVPETARETMPISLSKKDWPFDKYTYFLEYKTFGSYGVDKANIDIDNEEELVRDAVEKIEKTITNDHKEVSTTVEAAGHATASTIKQIETEVKEGQSKIAPLGDDDKPADLSGGK